jgi:hypothetical protein
MLHELEKLGYCRPVKIKAEEPMRKWYPDIKIDELEKEQPQIKPIF